jgi:hypothetical protein
MLTPSDFIEYDESNNWGPWRAYMRIKVAVDVNQPLKKEWKIRKEGGDWIMLQFKYEKLGIFCFRCGIIGHTENFCATKFEEGAEEGIAGWGPYLRAEARRIGGTSNRWLSNGNEAGQNSNNGAVQEDETEIADQGINGLANVENAVRTVIVQTIRNNQLITTKTQTLPPSPTTARPRQLLLGSSTSSTRIPRYQGTANENLTIVPLVSEEGRIEGSAPKKRTRVTEVMEVQRGNVDYNAETETAAMNIDPKPSKEVGVAAGHIQNEGNNFSMNCNPLFDVALYWQDLGIRPAQINEYY